MDGKDYVKMKVDDEDEEDEEFEYENPEELEIYTLPFVMKMGNKIIRPDELGEEGADEELPDKHSPFNIEDTNPIKNEITLSFCDVSIKLVSNDDIKTLIKEGIKALEKTNDIFKNDKRKEVQ